LIGQKSKQKGRVEKSDSSLVQKGIALSSKLPYSSNDERALGKLKRTGKGTKRKEKKKGKPKTRKREMKKTQKSNAEKHFGRLM